jgi:hypothetical protein
MGYRSTFVTDDSSLPLPQWFINKWEPSVWINLDTTRYIHGQPALPISSKQEMKEYGYWSDLAEDLQRCIREYDCSWKDEYVIRLMFLHEDGLFNLVEITLNEIIRHNHPTVTTT